MKKLYQLTPEDVKGTYYIKKYNKAYLDGNAIIEHYELTPSGFVNVCAEGLRRRLNLFDKGFTFTFNESYGSIEFTDRHEKVIFGDTSTLFFMFLLNFTSETLLKQFHNNGVNRLSPEFAVMLFEYKGLNISTKDIEQIRKFCNYIQDGYVESFLEGFGVETNDSHSPHHLIIPIMNRIKESRESFEYSFEGLLSYYEHAREHLKKANI